MPIYEYRCPNGHNFELFQRIGDPQPEKCEICGEGPVERVLYPVAVHFKGSGFYTTDYGRGSRKKESTAKESSSSDGGGSSGGESAPKKEKAAES
jgi:putative FmdB family regulatory protein